MNFTIIVPTFNRHHILKNCLNYYRANHCNIIIVDGSKNFFKLSTNKNEKYFHIPDSDYLFRVFFAIKYVKTKYIIISSDDDFLNIKSIKKASNFLDKNKNYNSVCGKFFSFEKIFNIYKIKELYNKDQYKSIDHNNNLNRLFEAISNPQQLTFALFRKNKIYNILKLFNKTKFKKKKKFFFDEMPFSCISLNFGKHKFLNLIWQFRNANISKARFKNYDRKTILNLKETRELKNLVYKLLPNKKKKIKLNQFSILWSKHFFKFHKKENDSEKIKNFLINYLRFLYLLSKFIKKLILYFYEIIFGKKIDDWILISKFLIK